MNKESRTQTTHGASKVTVEYLDLRPRRQQSGKPPAHGVKNKISQRIPE
jgi:hypothetical protein